MIAKLIIQAIWQIADSLTAAFLKLCIWCNFSTNPKAVNDAWYIIKAILFCKGNNSAQEVCSNSRGGAVLCNNPYNAITLSKFAVEGILNHLTGRMT